MDDERDKVPAPNPAQKADTGEEPWEPSAAIPEDADEIIEIVDDDALGEPEAPTAQPVRTPPDLAETSRQIRTLKGQLERKDEQIKQVMEAYRAKKSETDKLRERIEKTERRRFEQSKGDFIARFVEVLDNLDRAIDSIENSFDADSVLQGIMLVRSRLVQLLKTEGLEKIFVRGQPFDPVHSEAAEMKHVSDETQDGVVLQELQPGYILKGSLLRVARVVVGRYGAESGADDDATRSTKTPTEGPTEPADSVAPGDESWEADESGHELEFSEDGLDFNRE